MIGVMMINLKIDKLNWHRVVQVSEGLVTVFTAVSMVAKVFEQIQASGMNEPQHEIMGIVEVR